MLSGDDRQLATLQREQGFAREMESAGLPVRILRCGWQMSDGYRAVAEGFDGSVPTAVFCIRDRVAAGVIHGAAVQGLSVPGDLSVIGFDDEDFFAEHLTPALTTIALPHERMGEIAMTELLDVLDGAALGARTQLVACPLVERDTVANPATRS
jgi:LacI family transcriptional regulator